MSKRTINEAITEVLRKESKGLTSKAIYEKIVKLSLYQFKSISPESIVRNQLRRHSVNVNLKLSSTTKLYEYLESGLYKLL